MVSDFIFKWDLLGFKIMGFWLALMGDGGRSFKHQIQRHCHMHRTP